MLLLGEDDLVVAAQVHESEEAEETIATISTIILPFQQHIHQEEVSIGTSSFS